MLASQSPLSAGRCYRKPEKRQLIMQHLPTFSLSLFALWSMVNTVLSLVSVGCPSVHNFGHIPLLWNVHRLAQPAVFPLTGDLDFSQRWYTCWCPRIFLIFFYYTAIWAP